MHFYVLKLVGQPMGPCRSHPILVSVHEIYGNFWSHRPQNLLYASGWLEGPIEKVIKSFLAADLLPGDVFDVLPPYNFLIFRQFKSVFEYFILEPVSEHPVVHHFNWSEFHIVHFLGDAHKNSRIPFSFCYIFLGQFGSACRRQQHELLDSVGIFFEIESADVPSKTMPSENKMLQPTAFSPLFNCTDEVLSCLLPGHFVVPCTS